MATRCILFASSVATQIPWTPQEDCTLVAAAPVNGFAAFTTDPSADANASYAGTDAVDNKWIAFSRSNPVQLNFPMRAGEILYWSGSGGDSAYLMIEVPSPEVFA